VIEMSLIEFKDLPDTSTPINAENLNNNFNELNPIGSVIITSTNTNPSDRLGGTWELIDKEFSMLATYKTNSEYISLNDDKVSNVYFGFTRTGHTFVVQIQYTTLVEIGEDTVELGTLNFEKMGISRFLQSTQFVGVSDNANAVVNQYLHATTGVLSTRDIIDRDAGGTIPNGSTVNLSVTINVPHTYMLDEKCDRFYWKRTA
jgi:hypothetical protein